MVMYIEKERDEIVVDLHKSLIEKNGDVYDKLNLLHLDYSYRVRYEKDGDGNIVAKVMDRGFVGLMAEKIGESTLQQGTIYTCFIYGKRTIGAVIKGDVLLCNSNLKGSSDFNVLMLNLANEKSLTIDWSDNLPTGEITKKSPKKLSDLLDNVKTIDELSSDLGF